MAAGEEAMVKYVTHQEFQARFEHLEERLDRGLAEIGEKLDRRSGDTRSTWLGIAAIVVTLLGFGAALGTFALSGATRPIDVAVQGLEREVGDVARLRERMASVEREAELFRALILPDVRVSHSSGESARKQDEILERLNQLSERLDRAQRDAGKE